MVNIKTSYDQIPNHDPQDLATSHGSYTSLEVHPHTNKNLFSVSCYCRLRLDFNYSDVYEPYLFASAREEMEEGTEKYHGPHYHISIFPYINFSGPREGKKSHS